MTSRRRLIGIADQAVSTLSNLGITVVAARALSPRAFGGFALVFSVYVVAIGLSRALAMEPLLLRGHDSALAPIRSTVGAMTGLGVVAGAACILVGEAGGGVAGRPLLVLGLFLPLLFMQDGWRYAAFAGERPARALVVDLVWVAAQGLGTVALLASGTRDPALFVAVWAGGGSVAAVVGAVQARVVPHPSAGARWVKANMDFGAPFMAEFMAAGGAGYAALWLLGAAKGLAAVGAVRVGQTVLGPVNVLYVGIYMTLLPEGARRAKEDPGSLRRAMVGASTGLVAMTTVVTAAALVLPSGLGRAFFGQSWSQARPVLAPLGVGLCAGSVMAGATAGMRALGRARLSLGIRLMTLPVMLALPVVGAVAAGAVGFSVGLAAASWAAALVWWAVFVRALAEDPAPVEPGLTPPRSVEVSDLPAV